MPIALVRSISLPNLKIYTTVSLLLVSGCLYYAFDVVRTDPQWKLHHNTSFHSSTRPSSLLKSSNDAIAVLTNSDLLSSLTSSLASAESEKEEIPQENIFESVNGTSSFTNQLKDVVSFMTHEPICIWVSQGVVFDTTIKSRLSICAYFGAVDKIIICCLKRQLSITTHFVVVFHFLLSIELLKSARQSKESSKLQSLPLRIKSRNQFLGLFRLWYSPIIFFLLLQFLIEHRLITCCF